MKPYYQHGGITIYHGDCREIIPALSAVDLVLTDPPYGISLENHDKGGARGNSEWTIVGDTSQAVGIETLGLLAALPVICFASPMLPWPGKWRQHLVWEKGDHVGGGGDTATCWKQTFELIQIARTGVLNGGRDSAILRFNACTAEYRDHPSPKPLALIKYLIGKASSVGDLILDPFMGSGTTCRAAKDTGRLAIGIEIEERYCELAARRLGQEVMDFGA